MGTTANLFTQLGNRWTPDADQNNAPPEALLRADNIVPDKLGAMALRRGSTKTYDSLAGGALHSIHVVELADGTLYRAKGVGDTLYINGNSQGAFTGTGDIAMADDAYQMFFARGTTKKKFDGTHWNNWGIAAPSAAPTLSAISSLTTSVAGFDNVESPAVTIVEGTGTVGGAADAGGVANSATLVNPDGSTARAVVQRLFSTDQDFFTIGGVDGSETDLIDLYLKFDDPRNVETIKLQFGADNSSTAPFTTDFFEFEFDLRSKTTIPLKDLQSESYSAIENAVLSSLGAVRAQDVTGIQTADKVKAILASIGQKPSPTVQVPSNAGVWGHLTVTRGQFKRTGSTATRGWDTIRGFKVIYTVKKGTTSAITLADAIVVGGGDRTLTGTYRCIIRAVRNFNDIYYELGPPSPQSDPINLNHQTLQVTINSTTLSTIDPQADQIWVYLFGGWLNTYYRFAVIPASIRGGMTIDEFGTPDGSDMDDADERSRITSWGFTLQSGAGSSDMVLTVDTSEMQALTLDEKMEPFQMGPPDNIVAVAGPWQGRMFTLTEDGYVYPSTKRSPGAFNSAQVIDLTRYGNPMWMVKTGQGIYVGMEKDVIFLQGSGDDSPDLSQIDLFPTPLNVGNPPVDACRWVDGNAVVYRSADGPIILTGSSVQPIPFAGTSLLWRGTDRHGVPGLNVTTGRFRCAVDDSMLYILAAEGAGITTTNVIYRYATQSQAWSRLVYNQAGTFHSIFKEPDGTLVAGDSAGTYWTLDTGTQDNAVNVDVNILTPMRDGGNFLANKDAFDLQVHANTLGETGTVSLYKNGDPSATSSYQFSTTQATVYRINAADFGTFLKAQIGITGSFYSFDLVGLNLTYRPRPQHAMYLDLGSLLPDDVGDLVWLYEIEFDAIAYADVGVTVLMNDVEKDSATITVPTKLVGKRFPFIVPCRRGLKGYRPRITFATTAANAQGSVGFECYGVRVRMAVSGNQEGAAYRKVYPVDTAP